MAKEARLIVPGRTESITYYFYVMKPGLDDIEIIRPFSFRQFKPIKFEQLDSFDIAVYDGLRLDLFSDDDPDKQIMDQAHDMHHYMGHRVLVPTVRVVSDKHFSNIRL